MKIYEKILYKKKKKEVIIAALLDPDSEKLEKLEDKIKLIEKSSIDFILVGGSTSWNSNFEKLTTKVKSLASIPVIIFPGSAEQISSSADAILFLSLLSGRNPRYLIEEQVKAASILKRMKIEVIPTGYILIDGGKKTSVELISGTKPIPQENIEKIVDTAYAAELLGMKLVYLECGSGARRTAEENLIREVKANIKIPLVVGGGIKSREEIEKKHKAGADLIVIGNALEKDPTILLK
ncbi:MAG: geranylgeranylglyceryl/heptaprenylglyceryl phosphate synthase [candidate division WOR-3 bacterium]